MPRGRPFSGKQKREQLQAKKAEKRTGLIEGDTPNAGFARKTATKPPPDPNRLTTVFEREPEEEIVRRKMDSTRPIVRTCADTADGFGDDLAAPRLLAYPIPEQGADVPIISIPKRPPWSSSTTPEELERQEQASFTEWLSNVYRDYPRDRLNFFEHNLEVLCPGEDLMILLLN
jgi:hypothetical protein